MNRDLLICFIFSAALLPFTPAIRAQEQVTSTLVDEVATLDVTTIESSGPVRSLIIRQEAVQQFYTPSIATKTLLPV